MIAPARARLEQLGVTNVILEHGDGSLGLPAQAPFDRIMVAAAAADPPRTLLERRRWVYVYLRFVPLLGGAV